MRYKSQVGTQPLPNILYGLYWIYVCLCPLSRWWHPFSTIWLIQAPPTASLFPSIPSSTCNRCPCLKQAFASNTVSSSPRYIISRCSYFLWNFNVISSKILPYWSSHQRYHIFVWNILYFVLLLEVKIDIPFS